MSRFWIDSVGLAFPFVLDLIGFCFDLSYRREIFRRSNNIHDRIFENLSVVAFKIGVVDHHR